MINKIETTLKMRDKQYQVNWDLKQVNILVGENGLGKTRLLNKIHFDNILETHLITIVETNGVNVPDLYYGILSVGTGVLIEVINWYKKLTNKQLKLDFNYEEYFFSSKGERYLLDLLANIYVRPKNSTVLIDDIEQNLHITIRKELLDFLIEQRPDLQFTITTHCPSFIGGHWDSVTEIEDILTEINQTSY
jgi:AAA15 family ATPase/GTPase